MSYLFGKKALLDQINIDPSQILIVNIFKSETNLIKTLKENNISFKVYHDKAFFNKFEKNLNHQNIITQIKDTNNKFHDLNQFLDNSKNQKSLILIIDSIQDPYNFGAILRTCEIFNVDAVIYKTNNQVQINDYVVKTSLGAVNKLNLFKVNNLAQAIETLKKHNYWIYASVISSLALAFDEIKYADKSAIIVGNEQKGISELLKKNADFHIMIKMYGKLQSLNVSVSTGILLYEVAKQLKQ